MEAHIEGNPRAASLRVRRRVRRHARAGAAAPCSAAGARPSGAVDAVVGESADDLGGLAGHQTAIPYRPGGGRRAWRAASEQQPRVPPRRAMATVQLQLRMGRQRSRPRGTDVDDAVRGGALVVRCPGRRRLRRHRRRGADGPPVTSATTETPRDLDIRITADLLARVRSHVEDFTKGEEAGFLLCSTSRLKTSEVLLARDWIPVPGTELERNANGSVLSWSARFNSEIVERSLAIDAAPVLVHSHGDPHPQFSPDDRRNERALLGAVSRLVAPAPAGTVLLGDGGAVGSFWLAGSNDLSFRRLEVIGDTIGTWPSLDRRQGHRPRARPSVRSQRSVPEVTPGSPAHGSQ